MNPRVRMVVIGVLACGFAALGGVWIAALSSGEEPAPQEAFNGYVRPAGVKVPDFSLTDEDGRRAGPVRGEPAIYAFIYSTCEDTCPAEVQQIRIALDELGHDVPVYGVSVDPAGDTPARAKAFLIEQSMYGRMRFLLGSEEELEPVWKAFGTSPQTDGKEHSAGIVLADARGFQALGYPASQLDPDGLVADLRRLEGRQRE